MKTIFKIFTTFLFLATLSVQAGEKVGNGGKGVVSDGRLYLLDLVEAGFEKDFYVPWGQPNEDKTFLECMVSVQDRDNGNWSDLPCPEIYILTPQGKVKRRIRDLPGLHALEWFQRASSSANGDLFGHPVYTCQNCYSENTALAIALINQINGDIGHHLMDYYLDRGVNKLIWEAWARMSWVLVDAPLKLSNDENSSISDPEKYMMASRTGSVVRIHTAAWSKGVNLNGKAVKPLDEANRAALIMHELLYFITESQGDTNSDRARRANARFWAPYDYHRLYPSFDDWMQTIPAQPALDGQVPYYAHELRVGQEFEILEDIVPAPKYKNTALNLVQGISKFMFDEAFRASNSYDKARLQIGTDSLVKKNTRLRVRSITIHQIYGSHSWITIQFGRSQGEDLIQSMDVYGGVRKDILPTIQELKEVMGTHIRLVE